MRLLEFICGLDSVYLHVQCAVLTEEATYLEDIAGFRRAMIDLLCRARRELCIFSGQLAHPLYHDNKVVEALSEFARSSRQARVRILIRDNDTLVRRFHRTHALAQRLTTRIEIRKIQATVDTPDWEFAVADDRLVLQCEDRDQCPGSYLPGNPVRARKLLDIFERDWPLAITDVNLRRLSI